MLPKDIAKLRGDVGSLEAEEEKAYDQLSACRDRLARAQRRQQEESSRTTTNVYNVGGYEHVGSLRSFNELFFALDTELNRLEEVCYSRNPNSLARRRYLRRRALRRHMRRNVS